LHQFDDLAAFTTGKIARVSSEKPRRMISWFRSISTRLRPICRNIWSTRPIWMPAHAKPTTEGS